MLCHSTGRPSLTRSISSQGFAITFGRAVSGCSPRQPWSPSLHHCFPPLYTRISRTHVSLLPRLQWSCFGPFSKGSRILPPGPWPGGAARNETRLSLKLQSCSNAYADGFLGRVLLAPPGDLPAAGPRGTSPRPPMHEPSAMPTAGQACLGCAGHTRVRVTEPYSTPVVYL